MKLDDAGRLWRGRNSGFLPEPSMAPAYPKLKSPPGVGVAGAAEASVLSLTRTFADVPLPNWWKGGENSADWLRTTNQGDPSDQPREEIGHTAPPTVFTPLDHGKVASDPAGEPDEPSSDVQGENIVLSTRAGRGSQLITLRLAPPGLGPLVVVLIFTEAGLEAHISVEDEQTMQLLEGSTSQLRRSLAELGEVPRIRVVRRPKVPGGEHSNFAPASRPLRANDARRERPTFDKTV